MDEIAAEAGISKPILYAHFGDKAGLAEALGNRFRAELMEELADALARPGEPREIVSRAIDAFVGMVDREPNINNFLVNSPAPKGGAPDVSELLSGISTVIAAVLRQQFEAAGYDVDAAEPWSYAIIGMVFLSATWWADKRPMPRTRFVDYLTTLMWDGLSKTGIAGLTLMPPDVKAVSASVAKAGPSDKT